MSRKNMSLTKFGIDDGPHNMDGLRLLARDGAERVEAFIGRKVMDIWVESIEHRGGRQSLFRDQYNALGKRNLAAIERIVNAKYRRGTAFNASTPCAYRKSNPGILVVQSAQDRATENASGCLDGA
jgi:hypothetical protein